MIMCHSFPWQCYPAKCFWMGQREPRGYAKSKLTKNTVLYFKALHLHYFALHFSPMWSRSILSSEIFFNQILHTYTYIMANNMDNNS